MDEEPQIYKPIPQRPIRMQFTPASADPSPRRTPPMPSHEAHDTPHDAMTDDEQTSSVPSRSRSVLNLTASTLFGIYAPTGYETNRDEPPTPWGTGALTPSRSESIDAMRRDLAAMFRSPAGTTPQTSRADPRRTRTKWQGTRPRINRQPTSIHVVRESVVPLVTRTLALFAFGVAYGVIVSNLHESRHIAPVKVGIKRGWWYLAFWGIAGIALGSLLPWVDWIWARKKETQMNLNNTQRRRGSTRGRTGRRDSESARPSQQANLGAVGADWSLVVRSIGAFVGIAYAIRKTPWQSTLQLSLTLALVNPVLWYLLDRSKPGFVISTIVGLTGTAILLGVNPDIVPSPAPSLQSSLSQAVNRTAYASPTNDSALGAEGILAGLTSHESVGVATWIASVLFCSSICFGNIGRRLAPRTEPKREIA
ncbi:MAG: hypothetical protein M1820_008885 [Bogoriella megaspora]|nr:MAG: hypothetical protein M1820_008885 [Bogoriella megaspora]